MTLREHRRSGITVPPPCWGGEVFGHTGDQARPFDLFDAVSEAHVIVEPADHLIAATRTSFTHEDGDNREQASAGVAL